jgi:general secretion pathway protein L
MKSVGVDIGSNQIKVVEVQSTSKGFQILGYQLHQLTRPEGTDQQIEIIEFLRELSTRFDQNTKINFAIRQDRVAIRNKIFPFNDRIKINKSLAFELEEELPFSSDSAVFDSKIVQYHGNSTEVLACAVPTQHVENLLDLLKDGAINPYLISTEAPAFANVFERWNEIPPQNPDRLVDEGFPAPERPITIVLNIGHTRTLVCAFERNQLVGVRSILWGGRQVIDAIAKKYNLPPREAQKEMENKAFILATTSDSNYEAKIFSDLISKAVRELARDLQLVLLDFKSEFNGIIDRVDMTGGVSMIQGLGPFLTQLLEVPVNRYSILTNFPNIAFDKDEIIGARLGVAIGLAIEGLKKPRNPAVNFLKGEFAKQSNFLNVFWKKWGATVQLTAACLVVLFAWTMTRSYFSTHIEDAAKANLKQQAKNVAGLSGKMATESRIKEHIRNSQKRADEIRKIVGLTSMNSAMEVLKNINDKVPKKENITLDVRTVNIVDSGVSIQGYVANEQQVTLLQQALAGVAEDGKVTAQKSNLGPWKNKTAFAFSFNVDRNIQKGSAQ